ncbi:hypothetical protein ACVWXL_005753 [Bradyrhizobium sp. GM22.5]
MRLRTSATYSSRLPGSRRRTRLTPLDRDSPACRRPLQKRHVLEQVKSKFKELKIERYAFYGESWMTDRKGLAANEGDAGGAAGQQAGSHLRLRRGQKRTLEEWLVADLGRRRPGHDRPLRREGSRPLTGGQHVRRHVRRRDLPLIGARRQRVGVPMSSKYWNSGMTKAGRRRSMLQMPMRCYQYPKGTRRCTPASRRA